ncbi:STAS/SEC14 domain-containing protein [Microbulbifer bruguierae]|uniref:STAS/SEC14 domain-containing protein n=1 Tax=Microbulbifer bruguierae TaxID=3029061 RepID=A0ABY8NDX7_9GAMM|nr:STAS/SEC14 domain-containing protein [Microbulbifer bruguierae]WGL16915.1 STAS/SEC14 domain-containing protein [Microbulbifer bruguierae]
MIEHCWHHDHEILEIRPVADLKPSEFRALAAQVDPVICAHGNLQGLLIDARHVRGWQNFAALISNCVFIRNQHRHLHRIAVLSDNIMLGFMPQLLNHFVSAEVRPFPAEAEELALDWLLHSRRGSISVGQK